MAHDVFISHSSKDKAAADAACAALEGRGIRCWVAPRDIRPGAEWGEAIVEAISGCRVMLLVFSRHANTSVQISREIERAVTKGAVIVPLRLEEVEPSRSLEYFLATTHWLDALTPPLESHLGRLADRVAAILAAPVDEVVPPPPTRRPPWWQQRAVVAGLAVLAVALLAIALTRGGGDGDEGGDDLRGTYELTALDIDPLRDAAFVRFPELWEPAMRAGSVAGKLVVSGNGTTMEVSVLDEGDLAFDGDTLRLTSSRSAAAHSGDVFGIERGPDGSPIGFTFSGEGFVRAAGSTAGAGELSGTWTDKFGAPGFWRKTLVIDGGRFELTFTRTVEGVLTAAAGLWKLEATFAGDLEGPYERDGRTLKLSSPYETSTWRRA